LNFSGRRRRAEEERLTVFLWQYKIKNEDDQLKDLDELRGKLDTIIRKAFAGFMVLTDTLTIFLTEVDPKDTKDLTERTEWVEKQFDISEKALIECGNEMFSIYGEFWKEFAETGKVTSEKDKELLLCVELLNNSFSEIISMLSKVQHMRESTKKFKEKIKLQKK
jgi:hypothetical protein